jgi:hypothetical protein
MVPVLSLHITVIHHKVSIDLSFFTRTFFLYIFCTHNANVIVTTAGSHSGIAEIARLIEVNIISKILMFFIHHTTKITITIKRTIIHKFIPSFLSFCWSGVGAFFTSCTRVAIFQSSVSIHVFTTTHNALHESAIVHLNAIFF